MKRRQPSPGTSDFLSESLALADNSVIIRHVRKSDGEESEARQQTVPTSEAAAAGPSDEKPAPPLPPARTTLTRAPQRAPFMYPLQAFDGEHDQGGGNDPEREHDGEQLARDPVH